MKRTMWIAVFSALAINVSFGQGPCQTRPGQAVLDIPLQPSQLEPKCIPTRIRVDDRSAVTLRVTNISPLEVCSITPKAQTVTPFTNPLESLVGTLAGFKGFSISTKTMANMKANVGSIMGLLVLKDKNTVPKTAKPEDPALKLFRDLSNKAIDDASALSNKQTQWQNTFMDDITLLKDYAADDYRGAKWGNFDPKTERDLDGIRDLTQLIQLSPQSSDPNSPPSQIDFADLQATVDQLKALQPRLLKACTDATAAPGDYLCDPNVLATTASTVDQAAAFLSVASDNLKLLQTEQTVIVASYLALANVQNNFEKRVAAGVIVDKDKSGKRADTLYQVIRLGTDYGVTDTGTISCATDTTPAVPTTDAINYSVLYQNIPAFTASAGVLATFLQKNIVGISPQLQTSGSVAQYFRITDSAPASVFPMAFLNYRIGPPSLRHWWGQRNSELAIANNVSAGIGVNPNTGTNQVEFFGGYAASLSRIFIHAGLHYGRQETLGGGFALNTPVPDGFKDAAPINWSYKPAFAIGISVRFAPF